MNNIHLLHLPYDLRYLHDKEDCCYFRCVCPKYIQTEVIFYIYVRRAMHVMRQKCSLYTSKIESPTDLLEITLAIRSKKRVPVR